MPGITVHSMAGHPEWIAPSAAWWHRQWGEGMGYSLNAARSVIEGLTAPGGGQAAIIALVDGIPAGSIFLVDKDLETHTHLSPWLAGLFVLPEFRQMGIGTRLTAVVAEEAGRMGHSLVYLYTSAGDFYRRRGWAGYEEVLVHDIPHEIVVRVL